MCVLCNYMNNVCTMQLYEHVCTMQLYKHDRETVQYAGSQWSWYDESCSEL